MKRILPRSRRQRAKIDFLEKVVLLPNVVISTRAKYCEYSSSNGFIFNGNNGNVNNNNKYNSYAVRPVSEFLKGYPTFEEFVESMYAAFKLCLKNKASSASALAFCCNKAENMLALCRSIYNFEYAPKPSVAFIVSSPSYREVIAADFSDRIVHHWVVSRLDPILEGLGVFDNRAYSCRVGKGNLAAIRDMREEIFKVSKGYREECYVASFDIQSFFVSIDKRRLYDRLVALVQQHYCDGDKDILLYLIRIIVFNMPQENAIKHSPLTEWAKLPKRKSLYHLAWYLGLPIGNLPSQQNANFYNAPAIRYMQSLGLSPINYVDDFYFVVRDAETITRAMPYIRRYFRDELGLSVHPRKFYLQPARHGVKILGGTVKFNRMYVSNRTIGRFMQRMHYFNNIVGASYWKRRRAAERYVSTINSYLGIMSHFATYNIRRRMTAEIAKTWGDIICFDKNHEKAALKPRYKKSEQYRYRTRRDHRRRLQTYKNL